MSPRMYNEADPLKGTKDMYNTPSHDQIHSNTEEEKKNLQCDAKNNNWFPPSGAFANFLTLLIIVVAIFSTARTVLGPVADVGGSIFSLLVLVVMSFFGGKLMLGFCFVLNNCLKGEASVKIPPLLGMLIVGIILGNVRYNWIQVGSEKCSSDQKYTIDAAFANMAQDIYQENINSSNNVTIENEQPLFIDERKLEVDHHIVFVHHKERKYDKNKTTISNPAHNVLHSYIHVNDCDQKYIGHDIDPRISGLLRLLALTVILLMAGLELDPVQLMNMSGIIARATFIPCIVEAISVSILSHYLLDFPWPLGFMLGFVLAAVSPAVIIPCLISLSQRGYGAEKGIPTLVLAACSADDVVAISGFGIFLGITFHTGKPLWRLILHGPIEIILGVTFGIIWGFLAQWIPNKDHKWVGLFRWMILFSGGLIAIFGAHLTHYDGAGGLAAIVMAFMAGKQWRKQGWHDHNPVTDIFGRMWIILEPVLFGLIGTELDVHKIDLDGLGKCTAVLIISVIIRMIATYGAVFGGNLNNKERLFVAVAWLPKATVQAALGPIFLYNVLKVHDGMWRTPENKESWVLANPGRNVTEWHPIGDKEQWVLWGEDILTMAVLSIVITAPLGALLIMQMGTKLLQQDEEKYQSLEYGIQNCKYTPF